MVQEEAQVVSRIINLIYQLASGHITGYFDILVEKR